MAIAPPAHAGGWSRPVRIGGSAYQPTIAGNERGDAIVAWSTKHVAFAALRRTGGRFSGPIRLVGRNPGRVRSFATAIDARGDAFVGLVDDSTSSSGATRGRCCRILVGIARKGRKFQIRPVSIPGESIYSPELAVGPGGNAIVLWSVGDFLVGAVGDARTGFKRPRVIGTLHGFFRLTWLPAVDAAGRILLLETFQHDNREFLLGRAARRFAHFGPQYELSAASNQGSRPEFNALQFEPDAALGGLAAWVGRPYRLATCCQEKEKLYAASWRYGGQQIARQELATLSPPAAPTLTVAPNGRALIAWIGNDVQVPGGPARGSFGVQLAERRPGARFELQSGFAAYPYCCLSAPSLTLAVNKKGDAVLGWERLPEGGRGMAGTATIRRRGGSLGPIHYFQRDLASFTPPDQIGPIQVATIDARGRATVLLGSHDLYAASYNPARH